MTQPPWYPNHGPTPEQAAAAIRTAAGQDQPDTDRTALRDRLRRVVWHQRAEDAGAEVVRLRAELAQARGAALGEAADLLRDLYFTENCSVQEIGTALRHMATEAQQADHPQPEDTA